MYRHWRHENARKKFFNVDGNIFFLENYPHYGKCVYFFGHAASEKVQILVINYAAQTSSRVCFMINDSKFFFFLVPKTQMTGS